MFFYFYIFIHLTVLRYNNAVTKNYIISISRYAKTRAKRSAQKVEPITLNHSSYWKTSVDKKPAYGY